VSGFKPTLDDRRRFVQRKIEGKDIAKLKAVRLDSEGAQILADETRVVNDNYFVETKLSDTDGDL